MSTTQELLQASNDLRVRRTASLHKRAEGGSKTMELLGKVDPEVWGALLGLGAGAGIGGAIKGGKGALIGGGIGAAAGAGAGYGYRRRDDIAETVGKGYDKTKEFVTGAVDKTKEVAGNVAETAKEYWDKGTGALTDAAKKALAEGKLVMQDFANAPAAAKAEAQRLIAKGQAAADSGSKN